VSAASASDDDEGPRLARAWFDAIAVPEVAAGLAALHARVAEEVAARKPICLASGQCCHFERFGHRLFVTGLDAAWCVRSLVDRNAPAACAATSAGVHDAQERGTCPFLIDGRWCGAHVERPLGCRIYFCDRAARDWQEALYEETHRALAALHDRHAIPYRYGEWRAMLALVVGGAAGGLHDALDGRPRA
jgi:Fe-S-cluster containining protein